MMKKIFCIIFVISLILTSCSDDIFDNIKQYASTEKVYVGKCDKADVYVGYKRVEIDLLEVGRVPQDQISIGKATKTIVEYDDQKVVYEGARSWVSVPNLTEQKLYRFTVYYGDDLGNTSIPVTCSAIPYTDYDAAFLDIANPVYAISPTTAEFKWLNGLSSLLADYAGLVYTYTDKDGVVKNETTEEAIFSAANLPGGVEIPVKVVFSIIPRMDEVPIIDTLTLERNYVVSTNTAEEYIASRTDRVAMDPYIDGTNGTLTWGTNSEHAIWSEIRYVGMTGDLEVVRTEGSENVAECPSMRPGELFETRTAFTPPGAQDVYIRPWVKSDSPFLSIPSGSYTVLASSYRLNTDGSKNTAQYSNEDHPFTLQAIAPGIYEISDMWGGYYYYGNGYGGDYDDMDPDGRIKYDGTNFSFVDADKDYWSYGFDAVEGTFDATTKTLHLQVHWGGYIFFLDIKKK
jgi:hypothetical protein